MIQPDETILPQNPDLPNQPAQVPGDPGVPVPHEPPPLHPYPGNPVHPYPGNPEHPYPGKQLVQPHDRRHITGQKSKENTNPTSLPEDEEMDPVGEPYPNQEPLIPGEDQPDVPFVPDQEPDIPADPEAERFVQPET